MAQRETGQAECSISRIQKVLLVIFMKMSPALLGMNISGTGFQSCPTVPDALNYQNVVDLSSLFCIPLGRHDLHSKTFVCMDEL